MTTRSPTPGGNGAWGRLLPPTLEQLAEYATSQHVLLHDPGADRAQVSAWLGLFDRLDQLEEPTASARHHGREPGWSPSLEEDPHRAIARFCEIKGSADGPLSGWRIGVKDSIAVAGVPMADGDPDETTIPTEDAVVVERLLDAGAVITAKTAVGGPGRNETRNPLDHAYSVGMSSSGSAAAVAAGTVDAAIGGDQAGSVRWPAAWCGLVGMKATYGLVPSYGLVYTDHTIDHIGPMTRTVAESALMLAVMAGSDWRNPQAALDPPATDYHTALTGDIRGTRIGVIRESLSASGCEPDTVAAFERASKTLAALGAEVVPVSVPLWSDSFTIWLACSTFAYTAMRDSFGQGYGHLGRIDPHLLEATAERELRHPREPVVMLLAREHLRRVYRGAHFARAQNLRLELRRQIDALFDVVDVLITPTSPTGPVPFPPLPWDLVELATSEPGTGQSFAQAAPILTCCPFNLSGHPALTVPAGVGDDEMPRGLQIVGPRFGEHTVFRVGMAFEAATAA